MPLSTNRIKHVIYYMLENRSFDNLLGWLYDPKKLSKGFNLISNLAQADIPFYGLEDGKHSNTFPGEDEPQYVRRGAGRSDLPIPDPFEEYEHVNVQLFYPKWKDPDFKSPPSDMKPTMQGFLADYSTRKSHVKFGSKIKRDEALQMMTTYDKNEVNILNTLAENFGVSDYWFSSIPTQTNANRAFSIMGQSNKQVNNHGDLFGDVPDQYKGKSIWRALYENGFEKPEDWMVYYQDLLPHKNEDGNYILKGRSFSQDAFDIPEPDKHITHIQDLFDSLEGKEGAAELPAFSYLEPIWVGLFEVSGIVKNTNIPNSYHPPGELAPGEAFVKKLYEALRNSKYWEDTLLIITFDEHGGIYDHVPPPCRAAPPGLNQGIEPESGFGFDRFGVRVPTIMVSPWIEKNTVFRSLTDDPDNKIRTPYDHTSMIKTILEWEKFNITINPGDFGQRVINAPGFESVLNVKGDCPRTDALPELPEPHFKVDEDRAILFSELQKLVLPIILKIYNTISHLEAAKIAEEILKDAKTIFDVHEAILKLAKNSKAKSDHSDK